MSRKQLIALAVMAGLLLVIGAARKLLERTPDLEKEMDLAALVPEGFLASDASRIEIYRGSKKDEKVALKRDGDRWVVESRFGAPGKKDKIDEFLKKIKGLEGEFRSKAEGVLADYALTDDESLHFVICKDGQEEGDAWLHLLVGKKEAYGRSFVRQEGGDTVYTVNVNLASEAGVWGDEADKLPKSSEWIDKTVIDLDKDKVTRIALKTPDRSVAFEKREKKKDGDEKPEDGKDEKKEYEWVVASGGPTGLVDAGGGGGAEFKQSGLDSLLSSLDSYAASDIEDPAKKKELGLEEPGFRCEIGLVDAGGGGKEKVLVASQRKEDDDKKVYYMMVEGDRFIYKVDNWKFDDIFKESKELFEIKGLDLDKDKVTKVTLRYPDVTVELVKEKGKDGDEKKWKMKSPETGLELREWEPKDVARALAKWKPADYAVGDDLAAFGLAKPTHRATFVVIKEKEGADGADGEDGEDGEEHTVVLGDEARGVEGRYALLDGGKQVWVSGKSDSDNIFPKLKDFFKMDVADIKDDDITKVTVERGEDPFTLEKKGEGDDAKWTLTIAGEKVEHDKKKVEDYLGGFDWLSADDIALGPEAGTLVAAPRVTVKVEAKKDGEDKGVTIRFGEEKEGEDEDDRQVAARVEGGKVGKGVKAVFLFDKADFEDLAPAAKGLRKAEEKKEEEKKEGEGEDEGAAADEAKGGEAAK